MQMLVKKKKCKQKINTEKNNVNKIVFTYTLLFNNWWSDQPNNVNKI